MKFDEMGVICGIYWREEKCVQNFGGERKERGCLGDLGVEGGIILKCT
jgi:hypothetical protein